MQYFSTLPNCNKNWIYINKDWLNLNAISESCDLQSVGLLAYYRFVDELICSLSPSQLFAISTICITEARGAKMPRLPILAWIQGIGFLGFSSQLLYSFITQSVCSVLLQGGLIVSMALLKEPNLCDGVIMYAAMIQPHPKFVFSQWVSHRQLWALLDTFNLFGTCWFLSLLARAF